MHYIVVTYNPKVNRASTKLVGNIDLLLVEALSIIRNARKFFFEYNGIIDESDCKRNRLSTPIEFQSIMPFSNLPDDLTELEVQTIINNIIENPTKDAVIRETVLLGKKIFEKLSYLNSFELWLSVAECEGTLRIIA